MKKTIKPALTKLKLIPNNPGIYIMKNLDKKIIYIGKAKNLKNRLSSYFNNSKKDIKTNRLVDNINDFDFIVTKTEKEAFILENNLIKKHKPFFNIELKDNKTYPYIKINDYSEFPVVYKTRDLKKSGKYFGPFTDIKKLNYYLIIIEKYFNIKKCYKTKFSKNHRPCLYYHIGQCNAPCEYIKTDSKYTKKEYENFKSKYTETINQIIDFLNGNYKELVIKLENLMQKYSVIQDYEKAKDTRDLINAVKDLQTSQNVSYTNNEDDFDVISYYESDMYFIFTILKYRQGQLIEKINYDLYKEKLYYENILEDFIFIYYDNNSYPVNKIILPDKIPNKVVLENIFNTKFKIKVNIIKGTKLNEKKLLELAYHNSKLSFFELKKNLERKNVLIELKEFLHLKKLPLKIESFDIANITDKFIVAGMVSFFQGKKDKTNYRKFNIKSTNIQNDFISIEEAVFRRYKRLINEKKELPDLIMIDGGKGQLSSAIKSLTKLGLKHFPIISIAKKEEEIFVPKQKNPLKINIYSNMMKLLIEIRDETHRWTNSFHVNKRDKAMITPILSTIKGISEDKINKLFIKYKTLNNIKKLQYEDLKDFKISKKVFDKLIELLNTI